MAQSVGAQATSINRPYFADAKDMFDRLADRDRNELYLMLIATGDFNAITSKEFGGRLYDAIASFQLKHGMTPTGIISTETFARLVETGGEIFNSWGFDFTDHPFAQASMVIPSRFNLARKETKRGLSFQNRSHSMDIDFAFFPETEASMADVFARLTEPVPGRRIDMKVIRPTFFAVAGGSDTTGSYSRFIPVNGGIAGFTISWNTSAFPSGSRIAVVMANELFSRHMVPSGGQVPDVFETNPGTSQPLVNASNPALPGGVMRFSEATPLSPLPNAMTDAEERSRVEQTQREAEQSRIDAAARAERQKQYAEQMAALQKAADEARKKVLDEAEAARREAAARLRQDRFDHDVVAAKRLIDEASAFVKAEPGNAKLIDYLQQIAQLNGTLSAGDPDDTEQKTVALAGALRRDASFATFETQRLEEQQRQNARYLGDALRALKSQRLFLIGVVTQNPTSDTATTFLPLIKQADGALGAPDLERAQTLLGETDAAIQKAGLRKDYVAFTAARAEPASDATSPGLQPGGGDKGTAPEAVTKVSGKIATDKNRFLIDGDLKDIVLMFNTSAGAPHVVKNLRGELVFEGGRADACLFGHPLEEDAASVVRSALSAYDLKTLALTDQPCDADRLTSYDIVATRRGTFLREQPSYALALVAALEKDEFKSLASVTDAQVKAAATADAVKADEIANDVARGAKDGFGVILMQTHAPALCVAADDRRDAQLQLLASRRDKLSADMGAQPEPVATTVENAFVDGKHGQCGAIYAAAADLKTLADGFRRDQTAFRFSTLWIASAEVQAAHEAILAAKLAAEAQAAERIRKAEEERKLDAMRRADEAAKLSAQQTASRQRYEPAAKAAAARIAGYVKDYTDSPFDEHEVAPAKFPNFAGRFRAYLADRWDLMSENAELADYGVSDWKGRALETAVTKVTLRFKNRMLGDYKDECFLFGDLDDVEFKVEREPVSTSCDGEASLQQWKTAHAFKSYWIFQ